MKTDSKDLINHSLTVSIIQVGRVLDNSFKYKKKKSPCLPQSNSIDALVSVP